MKKLLIIALAFITVGLLIFTLALACAGWDFSKLGTAEYETNYHAPMGEFSSISINTDTADIEILPSADGATRVECFEKSSLRHSVFIDGNTLNISLESEKKWYEFIFFSFSSPKITVYLAPKDYSSLKIVLSTGDTEIKGGVSLSSLDISGSTGDVSVLQSSIKESVKIKVSTGKITLDNLKAGTISLAASTGDIMINRLAGADLALKTSTGNMGITDTAVKSLTTEASTGSLTLTRVLADEKIVAKASTGNVRFNSSDAKKMYIETGTGNVTGTLLSEKIFSTKTSTGKIEVPRSTSGGICEIITSTGNIIISISSR